MTKQLLIYENVVPLNREAHKNTCVRRIDNFNYAKGIVFAPLVDVEFMKASAAMPIVFAKVQDGVNCLALLGSERDKNAFVSADGKWDGPYVPAFLRRYPFVFAQDGDVLTLCIDESFEGLNTDGEGEHLFDSKGEETQYTRSVLKFVGDYQGSHQRTLAFCNELTRLDLLEEARADFRSVDGQEGSIDGFMRVSEEKLRKLPDEDVLSLFRSGFLDLIQLHLISLQQMEAVIARRAVAPKASVAKPQPAEPETVD